MPDKISPNEFRSFVISSFRFYINTRTVDGRREMAKRIVKHCDDILKKNTSSVENFPPELHDALMFVIDDFASNTNMMSLNIESQIVRILDRLA